MIVLTSHMIIHILDSHKFLDRSSSERDILYYGYCHKKKEIEVAHCNFMDKAILKPKSKGLRDV